MTVQFVTPQMEPPRAVGCILWLYEGAWEGTGELEAVTPPTSFDEWADTLRARGWTVHWTPLAAISQGPYRGGSVVEVIAAAGSLSLLPLTSAWPTGQIIAATDGTHRSYVAAPRAALPLAINLSVGVETPRAVVVAQG